MPDSDLHTVLDALIAPLVFGETLVDGYVMAGVSIELGPRVRFCRGSQTVLVEVSPRSEGLRCAVTTDRLGLAYRAGDTEDPVEPAVGMRLCRALADVIAVNEHRVLRTAPRPSPPSACAK